MASEKMSFENVDDDDDGRQMPAHTISSPMSLRLRCIKKLKLFLLLSHMALYSAHLEIISWLLGPNTV